VKISKQSGVNRFIYASSSSVYGVKEGPDVHEEMVLEPLTDYSKFKAKCEEILAEYQAEDFTTVTLRPATVCGFSPRQRLDVIVNIFANLAYNKGEISIFGGDQLRPNIHIADMVEAYKALLIAPKSKIAGQVFNVGCENHSVMELAKITQKVVGKHIKLVVTPTDDSRSYHISSNKIKKELGFQLSYSIEDAIKDLVSAFKEGLLTDPLENEFYFNIKRMQNLRLI
jgi:nucleoside-diphosphate-sugar epimerase